MAIDQQDRTHATPAPRATRCQLLLAVLFLIVVSVVGWLLVARLIF